MHENDRKTFVRSIGCAAALLLAAAPALSQITLYENDGFGGRAHASQRDIPNLREGGFNDRASSVVVQHERWQICEDVGYAGRCVVLPPGRYASLGTMGLNDRVSSARIVAGDWHPDDARASNDNRDFRRRRNEKLYQANVVSVRAVVAAPEQRCWMERQEVNERRSNVPGAVAGALIGGILGHQVGGGTGRDIATVGGAVAGGVVGSRVGGRDEPRTREVQRCENVARDQRPEYWDVTYDFRGREHHVQTTSPPGRTITVNADGEPRI